jgi:RNA recognition motif-containing protein
MNLYVSNLGDQITDESLRAIFATHGEVSSSKIIKDHTTGSSRGFGFVDMPNNVEAQIAMERINGVVVNGRNVSVKEARPRPEPKGTFIERLKNW